MTITSPAKDIQQYLESEGFGVAGTDLFYHKLPGTAEGIAIRDTGGFDTDKTLDPSESISRPTIQVFMRGSKNVASSSNPDADAYAQAYTRIAEIASFLDQTHEIELNSKRYISIFQSGEILDLGENTSEKPELSVNFMLELASV